jgi:uncharacterized protein
MVASTAAASHDRLTTVLSSLRSAVVALSGGVDSALVARVAHDVLGERALAVTATSPTLPSEESDVALRVAAEIGIRHRAIDAHELEKEAYARNAGDRCYHCKTELFDLAEKVRAELGFEVVLDGTLLDDLSDHRPGLVAAAEHHVRHPLVEAGLDKLAVRALARDLGLSVWDKPAFACLGSRFPVGTRVTLDKVQRVDAVERHVRALGLRQFRVRWHELPDGVLARIEVDARDVAALAEDGVREGLVRAASEAGFRWVTLDLAGYPSRSPPPPVPPKASSGPRSS